jgi:uncharacterized protein (DUF2336 family)
MSAVGRSLISELEYAVQNGSKSDRLDTLRKITDLFLTTSNRLNSEQIDVFDEVLGHLVKRLEARALKELSERLAPIENAPIGVIGTLARDDEITVAGPVLMSSQRLSNDDLIEIASSKGQAHLLAISARKALDAVVTDVLVQRGDIHVHRKLASSPDARFSEQGMSLLVQHAETDDSLTEKLGLRLDMPLHLLRQLLAKASEIVREKLLRLAPVSHRDDIQQILAGVGEELPDDQLARPDFEHAALVVQRMKQDGELDEVAVLQFAQGKQYAEAVEALSILCATPSDLLDRIFQSDRSEALIIPCRAAGLGWPTVRALLQTRSGGFLGPDEVSELKNDYSRLSIATAQRVLRFWCVQKAAGKDFFSY